MSNNLLKSYLFEVQAGETRIIDSNTRMEQKLSKFREIVQGDIGSEDISRGDPDDIRKAGQVDALFKEGGIDDFTEEEVEEKMSSNIIKEDSGYQGPGPEELLNQAQQEIETMMVKAQAEAEEIRKKAYESGHMEGFQSGHQECLKQAEQARQELKQKEEQLEAYYQRKIEELEPQFIDLLTGIYEHIFHVSLSDFKEIILYSIHHVMALADNNKDFIIRISRFDFSFISEHKVEIMGNVSANATVEIVEDITMSQGECLIETGGGIFDCSIDVQLEGLAKELKLLSYEKCEN